MIHWWNRVVLKRRQAQASPAIWRTQSKAATERLLTRMQGSTSPSVIVSRQGFN